MSEEYGEYINRSLGKIAQYSQILEDISMSLQVLSGRSSVKLYMLKERLMDLESKREDYRDKVSFRVDGYHTEEEIKNVLENDEKAKNWLENIRKIEDEIKKVEDGIKVETSRLLKKGELHESKMC